MKNISTTFNSVEHYINPSEGKYFVLPNGFGTSLDKRMFNKDTEINCPIFTCMKKEEGLLKFSLDGKMKLSSYNKYENYLLFSSIIYKLLHYNLNKNLWKGRENEIGLHYYTTRIQEINNDSEYQRHHPTNPPHTGVKDYFVYEKKGIKEDYHPTNPPHTGVKDYFVYEKKGILFFSMNSNDKEHSLFTEMLGMHKENVRAMVRFFEKYKFLIRVAEHKFFTKQSDRACRRYDTSDQFYRFSVKYVIQNKKLSIKYNDYTLRKNTGALKGDSIINFENKLITDEFIRKVRFPSTQEIITKASQMVEEQQKDKKGRLYTWNVPAEYYDEFIKFKLIENCPYVDLTYQIQGYVAIMNGTKFMKKREKLEEGKYYSRFYYSLSNIPRWIREEILIDGEKIQESDFTSLHPQIVGKLLSKHTKEKTPDYLVGDCHTKLSELLDVERSTAKRINLQWFNSKLIKDDNGEYYTLGKDRENFKKMDDLAKQSGLFEFMKEVKVYSDTIKKHGSEKHTNMSVLLMHEETLIMQDVMDSIEDIPVIYIFDALVCKKSDYEKINEAMKESLRKYLEK